VAAHPSAGRWPVIDAADKQDAPAGLLLARSRWRKVFYSWAGRPMQIQAFPGLRC